MWVRRARLRGVHGSARRAHARARPKGVAWRGGVHGRGRRRAREGREPGAAGASAGSRGRACAAEQRSGACGSGAEERKEREKEKKIGKEKKKWGKREKGKRERERERDMLGGDRGVDRGCTRTRVGRAWRGGRRYAMRGTGGTRQRLISGVGAELRGDWFRVQSFRKVLSSTMGKKIF